MTNNYFLKPEQLRQAFLFCMMNDILIRVATNTDAASIADVSRETFYNAFAPANTERNINKDLGLKI